MCNMRQSAIRVVVCHHINAISNAIYVCVCMYVCMYACVCGGGG